MAVVEGKGSADCTQENCLSLPMYDFTRFLNIIYQQIEKCAEKI